VSVDILEPTLSAGTRGWTSTATASSMGYTVLVSNVDERGLPRHMTLVGGALRTYVRVRVEAVEDGGVGVVHSDTGIFGYGPTLGSAVNDFRAALIDHLEVLRELEQAEPGDRHQLDELEQLLVIA